MNVLLVYPRAPESFWSHSHTLKLAGKKSLLPPLGLLTVAAMLPSEWTLRLIDLGVCELEDCHIREADYVFLSGMIVHKESAHEVARRCAALGKPVIAGGPLFTTGYREFPEISHFVLGEAEDLIDTLVADMQRGFVQPMYRADSFPDVRKSPIPRWDLVNPEDYVNLSVQFSRGCPFECEFCDITVLNGRVPRTKEPAQIVAELDAMRQAGWEGLVFMVDDNFIGNKKYVRALLADLLAWHERVKPSIGFVTEASINLVDYPDLYESMVQAGFKRVFIGIETPSAESLKECGKVQNLDRDLVESVKTLQRAGLEVMGGFIVGFDSDPPDIFVQQFEFIQRSGIVVAMVGLLTAMPETALQKRLVREGRMLAATSGNNTEAVLNFVPRLDRDMLTSGYRGVMRRLYEPGAYYERIRVLLDALEPRGPKVRMKSFRLKMYFKGLWLIGVQQRGGRAHFWRLFLSTLVKYPRKLKTAVALSVVGHHFRQVAGSL